MGKGRRSSRALARQRQHELQKQHELHQTLSPRNGAPPLVAQQPNIAVARAQIEASFYSGPIPPPQILAEYERVVPGSAAVIMGRVEKQSDHRMTLENLAVTSEIRRSNLGLGAALLLGFGILVVGARLVHEGHDAAGAAIVGTEMAGFAGTFVYGKLSRRKEREKKAQTQTQLARK